MSDPNTPRTASLPALDHSRQYAVLFVSLVLALTLPSFIPAGFVRHYVVPVLLSLVLLSALAAVSADKWTFRIGLLIVIPAMGGAWVAAVLEHLPLQIASEVLTILFFTYLAVAILHDIFRKPMVDVESIFAAVAVYMLMAYIFALVYSVIDMVDPGSFNIPDHLLAEQAGDPNTGQGVFSYFSMVTLTTLGFGDIGPISPAARSAVMLEAVFGQLYLVTMVARLVGLYAGERQRSEP